MTCWRQGQPAPAVFGRPAEADPALAEPALPGQPLLDELVLPAGTSLADKPDEVAREVGGQPVPLCLAEDLVVHGQAPYTAAGAGTRPSSARSGPPSSATSQRPFFSMPARAASRRRR